MVIWYSLGSDKRLLDPASSHMLVSLILLFQSESLGVSVPLSLIHPCCELVRSTPLEASLGRAFSLLFTLWTHSEWRDERD
jgi:hypothetical protein